MKTNLKVREEQELQNAAHIAAGKLASQVAHDLAGPLSSMQAAVRQFRSPSLEASEHKDLVDLLDLSAKRLATISGGLLDHYESGRLREKAFSLHAVLDELVGEYLVQDKYRAVEFIKEYGQAQILLFGDRSRLQRTFANIIKNAVEAMEGIGSISIEVGVVLDAAQIRITDTGPGMSEELMMRIANGGHSHGKKDGHGIGMAVVREVVDEYGGKLKIKSEVGMGTTFAIMLPLPQSTALRHVEREEHLVEKLELCLDREDTVAVIDDDASIRLQWHMIFEKAGYTCESYESWEDYHQKTTMQPTLSRVFFVVDYHFDNSLLNGIEIAKKLRDMGATRMILATAEYWKPSIREIARQMDITLCPKPLPRVVVKTTPLHESTHKGEGRCNGPALLVLDDDPVVRRTWALQCRMWQIPTFHAFASMEDCVRSGVALDTVDLAFVDKNIDGSSWTTDATISHLKAHGVNRVWISSGKAVSDLRMDSTCAEADGIVEGKIPLEIEPYMKGMRHERYIH